MTRTYKKVFFGPELNQYKIKEYRDDVFYRNISEQHHTYVNWINAGNSPEVIEYVPPTIPELTPEQIKNNLLIEISNQYNNKCLNDTVTITIGEVSYIMPIGDKNITKLDGAIRYMEETAQTSGYITDSTNTTYWSVPIENMKAVLLGMFNAALLLHQKKQLLRAQVEAGTITSIDDISWT